MFYAEKSKTQLTKQKIIMNSSISIALLLQIFVKISSVGITMQRR